MMDYIVFVLLFLLGALIVRAKMLKEKIGEQQRELDLLRQSLDGKEVQYIALLKESEQYRASSEAFERCLSEIKEQLADKMKAVSSDVLASNQAHFFNMAKQHFDHLKKELEANGGHREARVQDLVKHLQGSLEQMDKKVSSFEMLRKESQGSLLVQIATLSKETSLLIKALRHPGSRGKWGEMQLKRLVEMAGLVDRCDFQLQSTSQEQSLRADMIITLPQGRKIIIDSKVPLEAYIKAVEAETESDYEKFLGEHVEQLEKHIKTLADKKYWEKYHGSIEFTILFLPSEALLAAAIEKNGSLLERAIEKNVLISTPTTIIALLHAIRLGWKESELHEDAHAIVKLAHDWFSRTSVFVEHLNKLGKSLSGSVGAYNAAVNSFESRLLVTMRKLVQERHSVEASPIREEIEVISTPVAIPQEELYRER